MVVVAISHEKSSTLLNSLVRLSFMGVQVIDMPSLYEFLADKIPTDHISDVWLLIHSLNRSKLYYRQLKRIMDLALAALGLALIWPLWALIAAAIKMDSRGPVFFRQERLGKDGKPFQIIKFRTMITDAESNGPQFASHGDQRITRVGRILRQWRLDEMPQMHNILKRRNEFYRAPARARGVYSGVPEDSPGFAGGTPPHRPARGPRVVRL